MATTMSTAKHAATARRHASMDTCLPTWTTTRLPRTRPLPTPAILRGHGHRRPHRHQSRSRRDQRERRTSPRSSASSPRRIASAIACTRWAPRLKARPTTSSRIVGELHAVPFELGVPRVYTVLKLDERRDRRADARRQGRVRRAAARGALTMARLIYSAIASLDGYIADAEGNFEWAAPDDEVHAFVNDLERPVGTHLYGRRMYETMVGLGDRRTSPASPAMRDFAEIWRAADKVVYSRTLETVVHAPHADRARVRPRGGPALKAAARPRPQRRRRRARRPGAAPPASSTSVHLFLHPVVVGGGTRALPDGVRVASSCSTSAASPAASCTCATASRCCRGSPGPGRRGSAAPRR